MTTEIKEPCPKCKTPHVRGPYEPHVEKGITYMGPRDVQCCGMVLRWRVPIFKMTQSGYILDMLRDGETPFLKEDADGPAPP